jgi:hypothetical protein
MGAGGYRGGSQASCLQEVSMKEKDVEELAESVGRLVEKILRLVLEKESRSDKSQPKKKLAKA